MRNILDHYVISQLGEEPALGSLFVEANSRRLDEGADDLSVVEFLDLRHEYELLNKHRELLPSSLAREVRELTHQLDVITPWRRQTAHYRAYGKPGGQPAAVEELLTALRSFRNSLWRELHRTLDTVTTDPSWLPGESSLLNATPQRVRHNLPSADYDDTGLVGRDDEVERLLQDLRRGRERVITLLGEGGIGKSALALETAYRLLDDDSSPFELILWVSLKTERLTAYGIESISNAIESITGVTQYLGQHIGSETFNGSLQELADGLGDTPTLIVFDNLETTTGDEFLQLYELLPESVQFLVTSRNGIGQIERRKQIGPLSDRDAVQLFNWLVKNRAVSALSSLSGTARQQIVQQLRNSPLALKWYVMSVEAGKNPITSIRDQQELLNFCVKNVFDALGDGAQFVAVTLHIVGRPVYQEDLTILIGLTAREAQTAIQELVRNSLVVWTLEAEMLMTLTLTETANAFLEKQVGSDHPIRHRVAVREKEFREYNERTQVEARKHFFSPNVIRHRTDADRPAAMLLFKALNDYRNDQVDKAKARLEEARALAPDFWEVARVEAFIHSSESPELASLKYADAYRLAESKESRAIVAHHFGGHLARSEKNLEGALHYLREAHDYFDAIDTARALGSNLIWLGQYDEGLTLLRRTQDDTSGRGRVIAASLLIDGLRRRAEFHLSESHSAFQAWADCWESWLLATDELKMATTDRRLLQNIWKTLTTALNIIRISFDVGVHPDQAQQFLREIAALALPLVSGLTEHSRTGSLAASRLEQLMELSPTQDSAQKAMSALIAAGLLEKVTITYPDTEGEAKQKAEEEGHRYSLEEGSITKLDGDRGYGFIRTQSHPLGIFFHMSKLRGNLLFADLRVGQAVLVAADDQIPDRGESPRASAVFPPNAPHDS